MPTPKLNPMSLSITDAAKLLSKAGGKAVTEDEVKQAIDAGAPVDASGNINLLHLGAWLNSQLTDSNK